MLSLHAISTSAISAIPSDFALSVGAAISAEMSAGDVGALRIYAATKEFISRAGDNPPNQPFLGTLEKPISYERSIVQSSGFGEISVGYGELQLINAEGDYDSLIGRYAIDGQRVQLRVGMSGINGIVDPYSTFSLLIDLTAHGWVIDDQHVTVSLRDNSYRLEVPAQPSSYGGTGGTDGGADLAGKRKPMTLGQVRNISPPLEIPGFLVYRVNDGPIEAVDAVYDAGGALVNQGDYGTAAAMMGALISSGFVTCLAEGLFMLGAAPFGKVTADVRGENDGGYFDTTADIIQFLVLNATDLAATDLDALSFDQLNVSHPGACGYYLGQDSNETVAEAVGKLMLGINGWIAFDSVGKLYVRTMEPPTTTIAQSYDEFDLISITRESLPDGIDPILKNARVAYNLNWTVQEGTELIADVIENDPELASYLATPYRLASPTVDQSATITSYHPFALDPDPVISYFANAADAQVEADTRMALYGVERSLYRFVVKEHLFAQDIGDTIFIQMPRFDLVDGKYLVVVQVADDLESNETEILGFG